MYLTLQIFLAANGRTVCLFNSHISILVDDFVLSTSFHLQSPTVPSPVWWPSLSPWTTVGTVPRWGMGRVWLPWSPSPSWPSHSSLAWGTSWSWRPSIAGLICSHPATSLCSAWPCPTCCCPCWCCHSWQWARQRRSGCLGWCGVTSLPCCTYSSARPVCSPSELLPLTG